MSFEEQKDKMMRTLAHTISELARCHDTYRLAKILHDTVYTLDAQLDQATEMVRELEHGE